MKNKVSNYRLERYALGELPASQVKDMQKMLKKDPALAKRLGEIQSSNVEILTRYPSERMAAAIAGRSRQAQAEMEAPGRQRSWWRLPAASSLAWAGTIALFLLAIPVAVIVLRTTPGNETEIRLKGPEAQLLIFRKQADRIEQLHNNSQAKPGDLLQIAFVSRDQDYGVVLSLDGRGQVTLHYPSAAGSTTRLERNQNMVLDAAYELDNAPWYERFFLVTSSEEISVVQVLQAAKTLAKNPGQAWKSPLPLGRRLKQTSVLVRKGE